MKEDWESTPLASYRKQWQLRQHQSSQCWNRFKDPAGENSEKQGSLGDQVPPGTKLNLPHEISTYYPSTTNNKK